MTTRQITVNIPEKVLLAEKTDEAPTEYFFLPRKNDTRMDLSLGQVVRMKPIEIADVEAI